MGGMTFYGKRVAPEVTAIEATNTDLYVGYSSGDVIKFEAAFPGANDPNNDCKDHPILIYFLIRVYPDAPFIQGDLSGFTAHARHPVTNVANRPFACSWLAPII